MAVAVPLLLPVAPISSASSNVVLAVSTPLQQTAPFRCPLLARCSPPLRPLYVSEMETPSHPSADAVVAAIRRASPNSPVDFSVRVDKGVDSRLSAPSPEFRRLCLEQLDLFRAVVHCSAVLSVYIRLAGNYGMDQLELHRIVSYPGVDIAETVVLVVTFGVQADLRIAEATLLNQQVDILPDHGAVVLPLVKHPFVVGFLVAEIPFVEPEIIKSAEEDGHKHSLNSSLVELSGVPRLPNRRIWQWQPSNGSVYEHMLIKEEQRSRALLIARSLATAYVMDQRAVLLQQSSWQNNVRMSHLVEQIRAPLSNIRALTQMLSVHANRSEISSDIIEDMLVQGHHMNKTLQQLQDAVYFTKANVMRCNEEALKKLQNSASGNLQLSGSYSMDVDREHNGQRTNFTSVLSSTGKDSQLPMPPLVLAPKQMNIRPCDVSEVLGDLVGAAAPLASKQQRLIELKDDLLPLHVAVEEYALRQALSNLIEGALLRINVGGKVQIFASGALAGGVLVVIDDDGPDMQYMTQMHSLAPFGVELFSNGMVHDNMAWNFVAGLTVAREILESYGCVVRVISPRTSDVALGTGGTCIELWLPTFGSDQIGSLHEV